MILQFRSFKNRIAELGNILREDIAASFTFRWKKLLTEKSGGLADKLANLAIKSGLYYFFFSPLVAMPFYNTCIFHPFVCGDFGLREIDGIKKQDAFFMNDEKTRLHGWFFEKPQAKKTVLVSHGNAGNITHRIELVKILLESGASVFIYDYSGFGLSHGSPAVDSCCSDSISAYDYLTKIRGISPDKIVLYGESIGTAFSCQLALKRPCSKIILQSSFQSLPQIAAEKMPLFRVYPPGIFPVNQLDTLGFVKGKHPPVLFIHGQKDTIISPGNSEELYRASSGRRFIARLPLAEHNDVPMKLSKECRSLLRSFLNED